MNKTVNKDFINITDSYKFYKSKSKFIIPANLSEYRRVINAFHKLVMKHIIEDGDLVYLPLKMGTCYGIVVLKQKKEVKLFIVPMKKQVVLDINFNGILKRYGLSIRAYTLLDLQELIKELCIDKLSMVKNMQIVKVWNLQV